MPPGNSVASHSDNPIRKGCRWVDSRRASPMGFHGSCRTVQRRLHCGAPIRSKIAISSRRWVWCLSSAIHQCDSCRPTYSWILRSYRFEKLYLLLRYLEVSECHRPSTPPFTTPIDSRRLVDHRITSWSRKPLSDSVTGAPGWCCPGSTNELPSRTLDATVPNVTAPLLSFERRENNDAITAFHVDRVPACVTPWSDSADGATRSFAATSPPELHGYQEHRIHDITVDFQAHKPVPQQPVRWCHRRGRSGRRWMHRYLITPDHHGRPFCLCVEKPSREGTSPGAIRN